MKFDDYCLPLFACFLVVLRVIGKQMFCVCYILLYSPLWCCQVCYGPGSSCVCVWRAFCFATDVLFRFIRSRGGSSTLLFECSTAKLVRLFV